MMQLSDYFHYLCTQIPIRSRRVDAFLLLKGEMAETRTWEGRGIIHNIKVRLLCA